MSLLQLLRLARRRALKETDSPPRVVLAAVGVTSKSIGQTDSITFQFSATRTNYTRTVTPSAVGLPANVTATFNPSSIQFDQTLCEVTLTSAGASTVANDPFQIHCVGTNLNPVDLDLTLAVTAPAPATITLVATPLNASLVQDTSTTVDVALSRSNFTGDVTLAVTGLPSGLSGAFSVNPMTNSDTLSVLTITDDTTAATVTADSYTITGTGSGISATTAGATTVTVTASTPPSYVAQQFEDFTSYGNTAALVNAVTNGSALYQSDDINGSTVVLDTVETYNGHPTMRYDFAAGGSSTSQITGKVNPTLGKCWARVAMKFEPGFTTTGILNGFLAAQGTGTCAISESGGVYTATFSQSQSGLVGNGIKLANPTVITAANESDTVNSWQVVSGSGTSWIVTKVNPSTADTLSARIWRQTYANNPSGYSTSNAYKMLFLAFTGTNGRSGIELTNTDDYLSYIGGDSAVFSPSSAAFARNPVGGGLYKNIVDEWTTDEWYEVVIYHERISSTSGRFRWWQRKEGDAAWTLCQQTNGGAPLDVASGTIAVVNKILLGRNYNQRRGPSQAYSLWWGEWEIVDGSTYTDPWGVGA